MLNGHRAGLSNCLYNFDCSLIASSSMDKSAKVWDARTNRCVATLLGHDDEVLDLAFDNRGRKLATASSDTTARVWNVSNNFEQLALMEGHKEEVSKGKLLVANNSLPPPPSVYIFIYNLDRDHFRACVPVCFSPNDHQLLTASSDRTARLWSASDGVCLQQLRGHTDDIFACAFTYSGDSIITASKDNTCTIWR